MSNAEYTITFASSIVAGIASFALGGNGVDTFVYTISAQALIAVASRRLGFC